MNISKNGIDLIKKFEGCVLQVYLDIIGVKTVGYGHTGADVNAMPVGARISQDKADELLMLDIAKFEKNVNKYDMIYRWNQNEFDALCSFAFNLGSIDQLVAKGARSKRLIADKILEYNKAGGKVISGLVHRRELERQLFLSSQEEPTTDITYQIGKIYTLDANLYIRKEPEGEKLKYDLISNNARENAYFDDFGQAILYKGTKVTCKGVRKTDDSTWLQIPSGWVCARRENERYII